MGALIRSNLSLPGHEQERWTRQWSLRDVLYVLFRHLKIGMLFFTLVMVAVIATLLSMNDVFQSEAKLLVRLGRESVALDPTILASNIANVSQSRSNEINSELEILESADLIENLITEIGATVILPNTTADGDPRQVHEMAVEQLRENLSIRAVKDSNVIVVTYKHTNPETAKRVLAQGIKLYLDKHIAVHQASGSYDFLKEQEGQHRRHLQEIEQNLQKLQDETGIFSLEDQRKLLYGQISSRQAQLEDARREIASVGAKIQDLQAALSDLPENLLLQQSTGNTNVAADTLRNRLYELKLQKQELKTKYKQGTAEVRDLNAQIALTERLLVEERSGRVQIIKGLNANRQQIELKLIEAKSTLAGQHAQVELLEKQIAASQRQLDLWNNQEEGLARLKRERILKEATHQKYAERLEQARVDNALEKEKISNISILQRPTLPTVPTGPNSVWILVAGFLAASFGALGIIFLLKLLDDSVQTSEQVGARLGLPVLASFPEHNSLRSLSEHHAVVGEHDELALPHNILEGFEDLRNQLLHDLDRSQHKSCQIIGVSSCRRHSGVTTVATNLALSMARKANADVLLVDANLKNPTITREYELVNKPGFSDILVNHTLSNCSLIEHQSSSGLRLLPAGNAIDRIGMEPPLFSSWIEASSAQRCKYIIVDLPAIHGSGFAANMAGLCDAVVLVIDSPHSRWQRTKRATQELAAVNAGMLGVVLNRRSYPIPNWLYRHL